ncbi:MAG: hypothetical protein AAB870_03805 [Patescibacteria group bacterium]
MKEGNYKVISALIQLMMMVIDGKIDPNVVFEAIKPFLPVRQKIQKGEISIGVVLDKLEIPDGLMYKPGKEKGVAVLTKKDGQLFFNDRKIILLRGSEITKREGRDSSIEYVPAAIARELYETQTFIPPDWDKDENNIDRMIAFSDDLFIDEEDGARFAASLQFCVKKWTKGLVSMKHLSALVFYACLEPVAL